jgi:hypothetical protein
MEISSMPEEILFQVFSNLPFPSLSQVMLVSTMWKTVGQNPWLWEQCTLRITKKNIGHFISLMNLPIFSRLRAISICPDVLASTCNKETPSQVLKAIQSSRSIRRLYIGGNDLSMVEPGTVA